MATYTNVTDLFRVSDTMIDCTVTFDGIGPVPFTASLDDPEAHGREIFARALAGDFGPIVEEVGP